MDEKWALLKDEDLSSVEGMKGAVFRELLDANFFITPDEVRDQVHILLKDYTQKSRINRSDIRHQ